MTAGPTPRVPRFGPDAIRTPANVVTVCRVLFTIPVLMVVLDGERMAGMLTFREVIRILAKRQSENRIGPTPPISSFTIAEVMNPQPTIVNPDMDVDTLRKLMVDSHERYLPVMEGELLMGVISFHDVAKAVLDKQSFENKMLKAYIRDWPQEDKAD